jgi:hypothetical protein
MFQGTTKQEQERNKQLYPNPQGDPQRDLPRQNQIDPDDIVAKAEQKVLGGHITTTETKSDPAGAVRTTTSPGSTAAQVATTASHMAEDLVAQQIREGQLPEKLRETALARIKEEINRVAQGVAAKQEQEQQQREQELKVKTGADPSSSRDGKALFVDSRPPTQRGLTNLGNALKEAANVDPTKRDTKAQENELALAA